MRGLARGAGLAASVGLGLAAAHPVLIAGRLPSGHDAAHHLLRLIQYDALVRQGVLANWISEMAGRYYAFVPYVPSLSPIAALLGVGGIPFVIRSRSWTLSAHLGIPTLPLITSLLMASPASAPLWERIPRMRIGWQYLLQCLPGSIRWWWACTTRRRGSV